MVGLQDEKVYCKEHEEYKVKNAAGSFVCIVCIAEKAAGAYKGVPTKFDEQE